MKPIKVYACFNKNEQLRSTSSSGAFFSLLSEQIMSMSGVVYGVAMANECKEAKFIRVTEKQDLAQLRGSKYLQASVGEAYKQVRMDLEKNIPVLFTGTGCQINGLKMFLGKNYDNLFCVDVICHGVPSPFLWKKYVEYVEAKNNALLIDINFRCKCNKRKDFEVKEIDAWHREIYMSKDVDPYMQMFIKNYCLRPSCYECMAKEMKMSDMTMGDFGGIEDIAPEMDDKKGISLVLVRTMRGSELWEKICGNLNIKEVSYEEGVRNNYVEYLSVMRPQQRQNFYLDMKEMNFEQLKNLYITVPFFKRLKIKVKSIFNRGQNKVFDYGMLFMLKRNS